MYRIWGLIAIFLIVAGCKTAKMPGSQFSSKGFSWDNATVYFMLTDRFYNGDKSNDFQHPKDAQPAPLRGYMGGDVKGITQKIKEGYFDSLGVDVLWMTPLVENIEGSVDEGTGRSYGFHGYWTKDWTAIDKRVGTPSEVAEMVKTAHAHGIRVIMDAVINHTGPVTPMDVKWPEEWVKTGPRCVYKDYASTVNCTLVDNLPDVRTESTSEVNLPPSLVEKWKKEGRYEQEVKELDEFFKSTGYPRRPYFYIIKWLTDLIKDYGIDGYRVDTAKHTEEQVWNDLYKEAAKAYEIWKKAHSNELKGATDFYMVGEVYNYYINNGRIYDFGDKQVDYYNFGFHALINFDFKSDAHMPYEKLFTKYNVALHGPLQGKSVLNYISSHDDGGPFDKERKMALDAGTKLLLTQGAAQIYYGDETARTLTAKADGDATLRSFMNWDEMNQADKKAVLQHWQKIGQFRKRHPAIGAGSHNKISDVPYVFSRTLKTDNTEDAVVIALDVTKDYGMADVSILTTNGRVRDAYSGKIHKAIGGKVRVDKGKVYLFEKI
ncbi:MAG: alpha-amylase family glycosyl hydrolase [Saprospiraceae bacterium]|nr:alpha-amylase family glycosyl hydrolase [Saprospiraceae bacterium]